LDYVVHKGDKCAQMIFYPLIQAKLEFTDVVSETVRGEKGFGSTGK
jgi:dUTP pyrophosphatase